MCAICGCGESDNHQHRHSHEQGHAHVHEHGAGDGYAGHAPDANEARMLRIEQDILGRNNEFARSNRRYLSEQGILALNLVSSPGSGKTELLVKTIELLRQELPIAVIEGDQQTANDAERIRAAGVKAMQVNTGKGCHLDAHMVGHALQDLQPEQGSMLFIENVGNLVCPAAFDLGEAHKVAILSVTEGEDKPVKYPDMFIASDLMIVNKIDLLPYLDFDVGQCIAYARQVNPGIKVLQLSAKTGAGMADWLQWLKASRQLAVLGSPAAESLAQETV